MIYLDSSVALAQLFGEGRSPPANLWDEFLVSSSLFEYEVWNRLNARGLGGVLGAPTRTLIGRMMLIEPSPLVLARALEPFPIPIRTLDALHLASIEFLRARGQAIELATYDNRLALAANALGVPLRPL